VYFYYEYSATIQIPVQKPKVKYTSTRIAEIKNEDVIPRHALAMSIYLNKNIFPKIELSREEALQYLRKNEIKKEVKEKGWMLATIDQTSLGWLKSLGTRFNNYYPTEWRILMK